MFFYFAASIRRNRGFKGTTTAAVEDQIKRWLIHLSDRDGGRQGRQKINK